MIIKKLDLQHDIQNTINAWCDAGGIKIKANSNQFQLSVVTELGNTCD